MQNMIRVSKPNRALRFESLENRLPLATAAFMVNLYHDDNGVPGAEITNQHVLTTALEAEGEADLADASNSLNSANDEQSELASPPIPSIARFNVDSVQTIVVGLTSASSNPSHLTTAKRDGESPEFDTPVAMAFPPTFGYVSTHNEVNATSNTEYKAVVDDLIANDSHAIAKSKISEPLLDLLVLA